MARIVVVGAGFAGLLAACLLDRRGHQVTVVTQGLGGMQLSQGTIDVLGYRDGKRVADPLASLADLPSGHPYATIGAEAVSSGLEAFTELVGWTPAGDGHSVMLLPTAVGAWRPTSQAPASMADGAPAPGKKYLILGVRQLKDFHAQLIAGNLQRTPLNDLGLGELGPVETRWATIDFQARTGEIDSSPVTYARALDNPATRARFVDLVATQARPDEVVGLPAILGLNHHDEVLAALRERLPGGVFEITMQPPSVPGMRLNQKMTSVFKSRRGRMMLGSSVVGLKGEGDRATSVTAAVAGRDRDVPCDHIVFAPGGFESGAIELDSHNNLRETLFGLPLHGADGVGAPGPIESLVHGDYWGDPQQLFAVGVRTDDQMRPLDHDGRVVWQNVHAAGSILAGAIRWEEKSGEGIALGSAWRAAEVIGSTGERNEGQA